MVEITRIFISLLVLLQSTFIDGFGEFSGLQTQPVDFKTLLAQASKGIASCATCLSFLGGFHTPLAVADSSGFSGALADVGVGQYLVKDGRQLLRLALPVGNEMLMGKKAKNTPSQSAQESIELIRLRLEETGLSDFSIFIESS